MCGIAGYSGDFEAALLDRMNAAIAHRGPDDQGTQVFPEQRVGLAHRRLSIIDLSARSHQPMTDVTGTVSIVYNGELYNYRELRNLARHVTDMLHRTLDAFARLDTKEALEIVKADEQVDEEYEAIYRQSITFMMEDPRSIKRVMDLTWAARALERIGDHAKNICEYVVYMVHGKDIRHINLETVEEKVVGEGGAQAG